VTTSRRGCPVCGNDWVGFLHNQQFVLPEGRRLTDGYDVVCCEHCGFAFADTTVSQAQYDEYYATLSHYESNEVATGGGGTPWDAARLDDTAADLAELAPLDARVLDIGCANGGLLRALKGAGFSALAGVDPSEACVRTTASLGIEAEVGGLFELPPAIGKFGLVILSHVLEHVADVNGAIEGIAGLLEPDGLIYIEVPDASRYADFLVAPFQDFNIEHINHFSQRALVNLMARHGFAPVHEATKEIDSSPGTPYPALYALFRRGDPPPFEPDASLCQRLTEYIGASRRMMGGMDDELAALVARSPEIVVWGTGQLTMKLLAETPLGRANIVAFVDSNPINHGELLNGVPIVGPDRLPDSDVPIVVASTIHQDEIAKTIRDDLGRSNELLLLREPRRLTPRY
jgi:2-polyprenyl-3-methyl-5-hydroxy-6-metoxy-1,4-benzoquinol methylase